MTLLVLFLDFYISADFCSHFDTELFRFKKNEMRED